MRVFTKQEVETMLEDEFVKEIILPILEGLGWQEVQNWHGRQELGKDVVGWRSNPDVGYLESLAVVAKASAPSGAHGTAVISTQITQALNRPFRTRTTQRELEVDEVWVVVNKVLAKETRDSIKAGITLPRGRLVILDLDDCWKLVQRFVLTSKREALQLSQDVLASMESPYDLRLVTTERGQVLEVRERYPGQSEEMPLKGRVVFTFDKPERAQELTKYLKRVEETGEEEELPEGITARVETEGIDEVALQLFGGLPDQMSFTMGSSKTNEKVRLSFHVGPLEDTAVELPFVEMDILARGTKQMRLANDLQELPIRVEMLIVYAGEITVNFSIKVGEASAHWVHLGMQLLDAITQRGTITITNADTGIVMHQICVAFPQSSGDWPPGFAEVARVLKKVEERTKKVVVIPAKPFTQEEVDRLEELRLIVDHGYTEGTVSEFQVEFLVNKKILDGLLAEVNQLARAGDLCVGGDETVELFGATINLGRSTTRLPESVVVNEEEIRSILSSYESEEEVAITFKFQATDPGIARKDFVDWRDGRMIAQ